MAWTCLVIAGLLEIGWAVGLKYTEGFSKLWPSVATGLAMIASFALLSYALKTIPIVAMTANAMRSDQDACLEAGMDGFVSKPIDRAALLAELARVLKKPCQGKDQP